MFLSFQYNTVHVSDIYLAHGLFIGKAPKAPTYVGVYVHPPVAPALLAGVGVTGLVTLGLVTEPSGVHLVSTLAPLPALYSSVLVYLA